ncbi:sulfatase-like hydrolase/transferase [Rhodococcus opacus]|nr:sulfatase-like hydrolase/transferase [Rhodococcus opacus]
MPPTRASSADQSSDRRNLPVAVAESNSPGVSGFLRNRGPREYQTGGNSVGEDRAVGGRVGRRRVARPGYHRLAVLGWNGRGTPSRSQFMASHSEVSSTLDIRDSVPDWGPYEQPEGPARRTERASTCPRRPSATAPSLLRRADRDADIDKIAANGLRYGQWHTTALCSPTRSCLLTAATTPQTGWAASARRERVPGANGHIHRMRHPPRSWSSTAFSTAMVGKWHLCRTR